MTTTRTKSLHSREIAHHREQHHHDLDHGEAENPEIAHRARAHHLVQGGPEREDQHDTGQHREEQAKTGIGESAPQIA
ncbi:hypothetical protein AADG42_16010 [Ammonicoccus fulvus]|uniref:Uncharacterized protein n=1 Tax=Ammonicoccus fulvus TaxID=3138240 RepID=A0ABZ3FSM3_9ACTN